MRVVDVHQRGVLAGHFSTECALKIGGFKRIDGIQAELAGIQQEAMFAQRAENGAVISQQFDEQRFKTVLVDLFQPCGTQVLETLSAQIV